ncbi:proprotein convertase subtilisin/kexin type 1 inhibitor, like isoform X1 [Sebastes umbrosus]|uniref:proprotein convertase subtilisin/kexin type 1 inhibitor, like isoform X1 n=2 Tax=Sebastes umbrosus TaxID=72105 RepID=UPI0018A029B0|nr:proprotein convertase subtilisin/kexin type 1 inhibitor, like isoform X1 [Sebastes umbrosus]
MAFLSLLLLSTALIHTAQSLPAARGGGRGLDVSVGGVRRQRRDLRNLLPYEDQMLSYPATQGVGGANNLYYQPGDWRGRGLDQALQRLVERDQRREQEEEQRAAYLAALLRLLSEAESAGLVEPGDVEVVEEEEDEEDDQGPPGDFQGPVPADYDETGRGMNMGRPPAAWWGLLEPRLAQALLDRMEPQLAQTLLERERQDRLQQAGLNRGGDQDTLRRMVARLLSTIGPNNAPVISGRRTRRDLSIAAAEPIGSAQRRTRRSLDDVAPPSPSNDPPLLRVKRLEEDEDEELRPPAIGLQRMKRIDTMATAGVEELNHGSRRRRRREALNYDPQILIDQILEYM